MPSGFQVVEDLCFLCPGHLGQSFKLDNYRVVAEKVGALSGVQLHTLVIDRQINLAPMGHGTRGQLQCQGFLIDGLKEAMAQLPVYFHRRPDYRIRPRIVRHGPQITQISQIRQAGKLKAPVD